MLLATIYLHEILQIFFFVYLNNSLRMYRAQHVQSCLRKLRHKYIFQNSDVQVLSLQEV